MTSVAGTRLGPYEIADQLGAGGMGEVYRATDTRLDRTVAIKVLPEHLANRADFRECLEREAKAVSSLNHPHGSVNLSSWLLCRRCRDRRLTVASITRVIREIWSWVVGSAPGWGMHAGTGESP